MVFMGDSSTEQKYGGAPIIMVDGRYWDDLVRQVMAVHTFRDVAFGFTIGTLLTAFAFFLLRIYVP